METGISYLLGLEKMIKDGTAQLWTAYNEAGQICGGSIAQTYNDALDEFRERGIKFAYVKKGRR